MTLLLVLVVTAVLSITASASLSRSLRAKVGLQLAHGARQAADRFDQFLGSRRMEIQYLAGLQSAFGLEDDRFARISLDRLQEAIPMFSWIGYADMQGRVLASTGGIFQGASIAERPVFKEALGGSFMGDVHEAVLLAKLLPNPSGEPMKFVDISFRVDGPDGIPRGVLAAHLNWDWVQSVRRAFISSGIAGSTDLMIVSAADLNVILGPREELGAPIPDLPAPVPIEDSYFQSVDGRAKRYLYGAARTRGYGDFPGFDWIVLVREPVESAYAGISSARAGLLLVGLAAAFASALAGWVLSRRLARSLELLHAKAESLRLGGRDRVEFDSRVLEVAGLAESLDYLSASLDKMEGIALRDPLTGLLNRAGAGEWLGPSLSRCRREGRPLAVLAMDLDGFKAVNDVYGHEAGDYVLKAVSGLFRTAIRADELLCRWGGDEFVIVLIASEADSASAARSVADRVLDFMKRPIDWNGVALDVGCSIGGAVWDPASEDDWEQVLARADEALYRAKRGGKRRYVAY